MLTALALALLVLATLAAVAVAVVRGRRVAEARDAGVNEFLAKPLSATLLVQRLNGLVASERSFVETATYYGPCRRRRADPYYKGPERRAASGG